MISETDWISREQMAICPNRRIIMISLSARADTELAFQVVKITQIHVNCVGAVGEAMDDVGVDHGLVHDMIDTL